MMMVVSSSTRFVCHWFDEKWAVRTNIIVWEGRVSKGVNEEMTSTAMPPVRATKPFTRGATLKMDMVSLLAS